MVKALLFDLARTLLFPKDKTYQGGLNDMYKKVAATPGFKFFDYFDVNRELLHYIDQARNLRPVYVFTTETIQNDPALNDLLTQYFKKVYSAMEMGVSKKDPETYKRVAGEMGFDITEILFIDDSLPNIEAAKNSGMPTLQYKDLGVISLIEDRLSV
jgi:FMN phosphatase YigB (HAD superfamily)